LWGDRREEEEAKAEQEEEGKIEEWIL